MPRQRSKRVNLLFLLQFFHKIEVSKRDVRALGTVCRHSARIHEQFVCRLRALQESCFRGIYAAASLKHGVHQYCPRA